MHPRRSYEKGETQNFYNDFFQIFGVKRRTVVRYEEHVKKLDDRSGFIDLFWPGVLVVDRASSLLNRRAPGATSREPMCSDLSIRRRATRSSPFSAHII